MKESSVSATARLVMAGLVLVHRQSKFKALLSADLQKFLCATERPLRQALGGFSFFTVFPLCAVAWCLERCLIPGLFRHFAIRKQIIERCAREAVQRGAQQVVVIGAGLDPLASILLADCKYVKCFEVDHPATQGVKAKLLSETKAIVPHLIPADLSKISLAEALRRCPDFSTQCSTLFIAEGLTMYLQEAQVRSLLSTGRALDIPAQGWLFTCMTHCQGARFVFRSQGALATQWLRRSGEPFTWGLKRSDIPTFLSSLGFDAGQIVDPDSMLQRYHPAQGEDIISIPIGAY